MLFIKSGKGSEKNDEELIRSYRLTHDPQIIGLLFDRYSHLVFAVSMKFLKNEEDSKDAVIWVFEKLPGDLLNYEIHNFSAWLHTVTKNYCLRFISKYRKFTVDAGNIPDHTDEDDEGFEKNFLPHLDKAIQKLNSEQRMCIDLFYLQSMSYRDVSEKTGFSLNEVKSHIQNGKRNLKIILLKKTNDNI